MWRDYLSSMMWNNCQATSVLVLLDFSSAFDTIDHSILVLILSFNGSHPTDRTHYVSLSNHCSAFSSVYSGIIKSICRNQWQKKEALYKQAAFGKAALSRQALYTALYTTALK